MTTSTDIYIWTGKQAFRLTASGLKEDTLRVVPNNRQTEVLFTLTLPTLCITYADMKFQNDVGGLQANYPASRAYGSLYFEPPVEIHGEQEIERLTYIRGAQRVVIGPEETLIEFPSWKELVIPRLRVDQKEPVEAVLSAENVPVRLNEPLSVLVMQFADGRHIGGVNIQAHHPKYEPPQIKPQYDLWVRLLDAWQMKPLVERRVDIWHWDPAMTGPAGPGAFHLDEQRWTGAAGSIHVPGRPSGELEAVTAHLPGWRVTPRCFRPLAGQPVQLTLRAWPMQPSVIRYVWQRGNTLAGMAALCGYNPEDILQLNQLQDAKALRPGIRISLPCYAGALRLDPWDTLEKVAERFHFVDHKALAKANGLSDLAEYDGSLDLQLPGWHFFHARPFDTLQTFDRLFNLPSSACVAAGRAFRPHPSLLYAGEVVGVPV
ncbi:MAG: LysM peptidoglycan-binding domain-containing protein [Anaerolineae bacterium]|nr:LysM peptidoglycan-binding domain-containing protein [Anaerolineae bacterium]